MHYAYNKFILVDNCNSFNTFNYFFILVENNDLNFDEFIINCKTISHTSKSDKLKKKKMSKIIFMTILMDLL